MLSTASCGSSRRTATTLCCCFCCCCYSVHVAVVDEYKEENRNLVVAVSACAEVIGLASLDRVLEGHLFVDAAERLTFEGVLVGKERLHRMLGHVYESLDQAVVFVFGRLYLVFIAVDCGRIDERLFDNAPVKAVSIRVRYLPEHKRQTKRLMLVAQLLNDEQTRTHKKQYSLIILVEAVASKLVRRADGFRELSGDEMHSLADRRRTMIR